MFGFRGKTRLLSLIQPYFQLIHGKPPYEEQKENDTKRNILEVNFSYPPDFPEEPRTIISGLLKEKPKDRMNFTTVLADPWVKPFIEK